MSSAEAAAVADSPPPQFIKAIHDMLAPIASAVAAITTTSVAALIAAPATAAADTTPSCVTGQVQVSNGGQQAASGHRAVFLLFSLSTGGDPCTLTGYPWVDARVGGPLIHADQTMSGFMGGVRTPSPPTITLSPTRPAYAVVEGVAVDTSNPEHKCPTYTELQVIAPGTDETFTVGADIETCSLQIHPVNSQP
jgi:hypothetical protein